MPTNVVRAVRCSDCGTERPETSTLACPKCGSVRRTVDAHLEGSVTSQGFVSLMRERRRVIYRRPWIWWALKALDLALLVGGLFIGQIVGLLIGAVLMILNELLAPIVLERVIERDHFAAR
jgi:anti-sigma factor RsiW